MIPTKQMLKALPYRVGTSSYIIPAEILPNAHFLAGLVLDMEIVLFDVDDERNMPDVATVSALKQVGIAQDLTYNVHLPLDLRFLDGTEEYFEISIEKACSAIRAVKSIEPLAYVLHPDGNVRIENRVQWVQKCVEGILRIADCAGSANKIAVENLESFPPEWIDELITGSGSSRCVDIGHLWLQKRNAAQYLRERIADTSVIHLHGIGARDHQSLAHMPFEMTAAVLDVLLECSYSGILTLEIFSHDDFNTSLEVIGKWMNLRT